MKKNIVLFENPTLEKLSHVHPAAPAILWGPVAIIMAIIGAQKNADSWGLVIGLTLFGIFTWTLAEYALHRYFFHIEGKGPLSKRFFYIIHGVHHDDPNDLTRLVMPPSAAILLCIPLFSLFYFLLGAQNVYSFFSGFLLGYLAYDYTHLWVHVARPTTKYGQFLKKHHMMHHFAAPETRWGVSSALWDYVFGSHK